MRSRTQRRQAGQIKLPSFSPPQTTPKQSSSSQTFRSQAARGHAAVSGCLCGSRWRRGQQERRRHHITLYFSRPHFPLPQPCCPGLAPPSPITSSTQSASGLAFWRPWAETLFLVPHSSNPPSSGLVSRTEEFVPLYKVFKAPHGSERHLVHYTHKALHTAAFYRLSSFISYCLTSSSASGLPTSPPLLPWPEKPFRPSSFSLLDSSPFRVCKLAIPGLSR